MLRLAARGSGRVGIGSQIKWTPLKYGSHRVFGCINEESRRSSQKRRRIRLDQLLLERYPEHDLKALHSFVLQGKVIVDGSKVTKSGETVSCDAKVELIVKIPKFVSRAGLKLEAALDHFGVSVAGKTVLDCGISTGGFTDCVLKRGARRVYGIDVGYGDVAMSIRRDPRVILLERTNLRHLDPELIGHPVDLATLDVSFISVLKVIPATVALLGEKAGIIILVKPQFEARKDQVEPGGVVSDPAVHEEVIDGIVSGMNGHGFKCQGCIESPIRGAHAKNKEFLAYFCSSHVQADV